MWMRNIYERRKVVSGRFLWSHLLIFYYFIEKWRKTMSNKHTSRPAEGKSGKRDILDAIYITHQTRLNCKQAKIKKDYFIMLFSCQKAFQNNIEIMKNLKFLKQWLLFEIWLQSHCFLLLGIVYCLCQFFQCCHFGIKFADVEKR